MGLHLGRGDRQVDRNAMVFAFPERDTRQPVVAIVLGDVVEQVDDAQVIATLFEIDDGPTP